MITKTKTGCAAKTAPLCVAASIIAPSHLRLGEYHPAFGGHFAGLVKGEPGQPDYYLFVAPKDRGEAADLEWGGYGVFEPNAEHQRDGLANTRALIQSATDHPAAKFCADLAIDGFSDWYLPSREELRLAFINCREVFEPAWYWSSTQFAGGSDDAWCQNFDNGLQYGSYKGWKGRVRAVRRLVLSN